MNSESVPQEAAGTYPLSVEWAGFLTVNESGDYSIGVRASGNFAMVLVDGKPLVMQYLDSERSQTKVGHIHLEQGKKTALEVRYSADETRAHAGPVDLGEVRSEARPRRN